jgi:sugar transferase (PEP-CTERM/EpsH1 system associated)
MKTVTVLHLVHRLTFGGAERVLVNVINGTGEGMRHIVLSFLPPDDFAGEIAGGRATVVCADKREGNDWSIPGKIASLCRREGVDVIHSQGWGTFAEGVAGAWLARPRPRFVYAFRGKTIADLQGVPWRRRLAEKVLARCCNAILTPSRQMSGDFAGSAGISQGGIQVIYNGVDTALYDPRAGAAERESFGFTADDVVVGCVARLDPVKNILSLVQAVAQCRREFDNLRLLLVGDGPQRAEIEREIRQQGLAEIAIVVGRRADVNRCLKAMDIYVQPSLYEGVSNTILEAMSCVLPVIAGDVGGTAEIVAHGETGLLLPETSAASIGGGLREMLGNRHNLKTMGENARRRVEERFALPVMVARYESLFRRLARDGAGFTADAKERAKACAESQG